MDYQYIHNCIELRRRLWWFTNMDLITPLQLPKSSKLSSGIKVLKNCWTWYYGQVSLMRVDPRYSILSRSTETYAMTYHGPSHISLPERDLNTSKHAKVMPFIAWIYSIEIRDPSLVTVVELVTYWYTLENFKNWKTCCYSRAGKQGIVANAEPISSSKLMGMISNPSATFGKKEHHLGARKNICSRARRDERRSRGYIAYSLTTCVVRTPAFSFNRPNSLHTRYVGASSLHIQISWPRPRQRQVRILPASRESFPWTGRLSTLH